MECSVIPTDLSPAPKRHCRLFCRGQSEGLVGGWSHPSKWMGAELLSWRSIFPFVMLQWALLMGRAGRENHRAFFSTLLSNLTHKHWCQGNQWLWPWDARWTAALLLQWPKTRNSKRPLSSPAVVWQKTTQSSPVLFNFAGVLHKPQESKGREFHPDPSCYCCILPGLLWVVHGKLTAGPLLQVGKRLSVKAAAS